MITVGYSKAMTSNILISLLLYRALKSFDSYGYATYDKKITIGYLVGKQDVKTFLLDPISYMERVSDSVCVSACPVIPVR